MKTAPRELHSTIKKLQKLRGTQSWEWPCRHSQQASYLHHAVPWFGTPGCWEGPFGMTSPMGEGQPNTLAALNTTADTCGFHCQGPPPPQSLLCSTSWHTCLKSMLLLPTHPWPNPREGRSCCWATAEKEPPWHPETSGLESTHPPWLCVPQKPAPQLLCPHPCLRLTHLLDQHQERSPWPQLSHMRTEGTGGY